MDEFGDRPPRTSVLADLGPLPDVVISNSETAWNMFVELQARQSWGFVKTEPSSLGSLSEDARSAHRTQTIDEVMLEARRGNRVCPRELPWQQLHAVLKEASPDAPGPLVGAEYRRAAPLARRLRVREQVEWAAQRGLLGEVYAFLSALPESEWLHMGE